MIDAKKRYRARRTGGGHRWVSIAAIGIAMPTFALAQAAAGPAAAPANGPSAQAAVAAAPASPAGVEIVVTAERRNARTVETPITLTALSSSQLAARGATGMLDLTKVVPGLKMDQYGGSSFPAIRGITTSVSGIGVSSNVAVYFDGFYQSSPAVLNHDFPDISNVQVLKGPQGTLFGRNATGGAILVTTRDPSATTEGLVTVGYGTYNEKIANGFVSGPITENLAASLTASYHQSDGYTYNIVTHTKDGTYDSIDIHGKLKYEPTDWLTFKLQGGHMFVNEPESMVYRVEGPNATADYVPGAIVTRVPWQTSSDMKPRLSKDVDSVYLTAKAVFDGVTVTSLSGYNAEKDDYEFDFDGSSLAPPSPLSADFVYTQNVKTFTQELITAGHNGDLDWSFGGFFLHQRARMPTESYADYDLASVGIDTNSYAAYVDGTYKVLPKLFFTAGVRYSYEKKSLNYIDYTQDPAATGAQSKGWGSVTPRAVIRYQADPDTSVYASYSKGFAGGVFSPFSPTDAPAKPEGLNAFEVGFKHVSGGFSVDLAGFYYRYSDMQYVLYTIEDGGVDSHLSNVGHAKIYGLEASVRQRLSAALSVYAGGAYTYSKYDDFPDAVQYQPIAASLGGGYAAVPFNATGDQLIRTPKFTGNTGFNVHLPALTGALDFGSNLYFVTKSYDDAANQLPIAGHVLLDITANWTSHDELWKLAVIAKNVANRHYINYWDPSGSALLVNDAPPRTIRFTITRKF
jgi:iron complex outermembrane recepter protein